MSTVYSARAEYTDDCYLFVEAIRKHPESFIIVAVHIKQHVEIESLIQIEFRDPVVHSDLLQLLKGLQNCHVLLETLEPLPFGLNRMEREYLRK